jgi:hypothetical protein
LNEGEEKLASLSGGGLQSIATLSGELAETERRYPFQFISPAEKDMHCGRRGKAKAAASYALLYEGFPRLVSKFPNIRLRLSLVKLRKFGFD